MAGGLPKPLAVANQYQIDIWIYFCSPPRFIKCQIAGGNVPAEKFCKPKSGNRSRYLDVSAAGLVVHVRGGSDL